ncbi:16818_t:CDS:1 [Cetraspora pellucida]|uniref:16818_t:CDS:1 n=1 Tax=Cetraspora pellucida TaxID=1433469 RepID=A0ACA9MB39_9GLOM|nr:16818_t:CDS:1 [Cetraspora pellucida]
MSDYDELYKQAVRAYNNYEYKTSYNHFLTVANSKCRIANDAKFYLAKQYEMEKIPEVAKTYNTTFNLYEQVSNSQSNFKYHAKYWLAQYYDKNNEYQQAFELYLDIYIGRPAKFKGTNLLLAERIKNNKGFFTDKEKEFQFYSDLYTNGRGYKDFARTKLIECYKDGIGVSKDEEKALQLTKESLNK